MENVYNYKLSLVLPMSIVNKMEVVDLPENLKIYFSKYLDNMDIVDEKERENLELRKKYAANFIILENLIHYMIDADKNYDDAYIKVRDTMDEVLKEIDDMIIQIMNDDEIGEIFSHLFKDVLKVIQKRKGNGDDKFYISLNDMNGCLLRRIDTYGIGELVSELLEDENISKDIEKKSIIPIKNMLNEFVLLFLDLDEVDCFDVFSDVLEQQRRLIVYQAIVNVIVGEAIDKNLNISGAIDELGHDNLIAKSKEMILGYYGFDEYKEELEDILKLFLENETQ